MLEQSFNISGTLRIEYVMRAKAFELEARDALERLSTQQQPDAAEAVEQLQHVAYFDEGQFHWMSGIAPRDCELYARPIRAGGQP